MSNVVALRPKSKTATSPAFEEAWSLFPDTGRIRSSRKQSWPAWTAVCREIGEADLVERVRRYAAEDKEHRRECGAPGFHRWLAWGRWEHWAPKAPSVPVATVQKVFPEASLRAAFHLRFHDERARDWFDRCGWDATEREVVNCPPARLEWINGPFRDWAVLNDIRGFKSA